jgi:hypothetical protein
MKNLIITGALLLCIALSGCKGNGSTDADADASATDTTKGLNDGNGAAGSGTGSAGAGTVGDTTFTQQDTVNGAPNRQKTDTTKH